MSFFVQAIVGLGYMRNACSIYKKEGDVADPTWFAQPIGDPSSEGFSFKNADDGVGVFSTAIGINPVGFSPYGDLVTVKYKILEFSAGFPASFVPLASGPSKVGTVWGWYVFPAFDPALAYALVFLPREDGGEEAIFALPDELSLFTKNPHFP